MTVHLIIKGKVQGVSFRAYAKQVAEELGVHGWIKNTKEGHVETVAEAEAAVLQQFIDWCRQGPRRASVRELSVKETEQKGFAGFEIIRE